MSQISAHIYCLTRYYIENQMGDKLILYSIFDKVFIQLSHLSALKSIHIVPDCPLFQRHILSIDELKCVWYLISLCFKYMNFNWIGSITNVRSEKHFKMSDKRWHYSDSIALKCGKPYNNPADISALISYQGLFCSLYRCFELNYPSVTKGDFNWDFRVLICHLAK